MNTIQTIDELECELSRPTEGVLDTLHALDGDVMVLGAGGKMGPTLARMVRRAFDAIGHKQRRGNRGLAVFFGERFSIALAAWRGDDCV